MKHTIKIFLFLLIISKQGLAQNAPLLNEHLIDNYIDKFVGTWKWVSNQDTVTIRFKKITYYQTNTAAPFYTDVLIGTHRYVKNGIVIEDDMNQFNNIGQSFRGSFYGWSNNKGTDTCSVYMTFRDITKNKQELIDLKYLPIAIPKISWLLYNKEGIDRPGKIPGLTLPSELLLIKQ